MVAGENDVSEFIPLTWENLGRVSEVVWYPNDRSFRLCVGHQVIKDIGPDGFCKITIADEAHLAIDNILFATMGNCRTRKKVCDSVPRTEDPKVFKSFLTPLGVITNLIESNFGRRFKSCEVSGACVRVILA